MRFDLNKIVKPTIIIAGVVGFIFVFYLLFWNNNDFDEQRYLNDLQQIQANDLLATQIFFVEPDISREDYAATARGGIELYRESLVLLANMERLEDIPSDRLQLVQEIQRYSALRIEMFEFLEASALENTDRYDQQIQEIGEEIEALDVYEAGRLAEEANNQTQ